LRASLQAARKYLSERNTEVLDHRSPVTGSVGDFTTTCIEDRDCVFAMYEGDIAKCSLEKAFLNHETRWRKPLSCHLFPIRVDRGGVDRLRFEYLTECKPAIARGEAEGIYVTEFVKDALIRNYGTAAYEAIEGYCQMKRNHR